MNEISPPPTSPQNQTTRFSRCCAFLSITLFSLITHFLDAAETFLLHPSARISIEGMSGDGQNKQRQFLALRRSSSYL
jgi:hypothetical protein